MWDKQSMNLGTDGTTIRTMVVNIKSIAHVCSHTFLSIFLRRDTIVFWKMSLLHWLTQLTDQTCYTEKTIGEVLWRQWRNGYCTLKTVPEITFCSILTTGFASIVITTWFMKKNLVPCIIVTISITIIAVAVFITLLFLLLLSPWLCWCSSFHYYWCWCNCCRYCCHFCSIVVIIASLFCSFWQSLCIITVFNVIIVIIDVALSFLLFYCCCFLLSLLMPLSLHVVFSCYYHYCCRGVVVIIIIGERVVVAIIIIVLITLLFPILHHCFVLFHGFLISLSFSSHYTFVIVFLALFYRELSSYSFLPM